MNYPSTRALRSAFPELTPEQATTIRGIMDRSIPPAESDTAPIYGGTRLLSRLERIDRVLDTHGVEYQPAGRGERSPAFYYCNAGDTYATTILRVRGRFRIGCWGDIVERGNYA